MEMKRSVKRITGKGMMYFESKVGTLSRVWGRWVGEAGLELHARAEHGHSMKFDQRVGEKGRRCGFGVSNS
jgi:hypothetical protein